MEDMVKVLMEKETIDREEVARIFNKIKKFYNQNHLFPGQDFTTFGTGHTTYDLIGRRYTLLVCHQSDVIGFILELFWNHTC